MRMTINNLSDALRIHRHIAERIYRLVKKQVEPHCGIINGKYRSYNPYSDIEYRMFEIDMLLDTHGVEYVEHKRDTRSASYGLLYCNTGYAYDVTIIYDYARNAFRLCDFGALVERNSQYV